VPRLYIAPFSCDDLGDTGVDQHPSASIATKMRHIHGRTLQLLSCGMGDLILFSVRSPDVLGRTLHAFWQILHATWQSIEACL
jgi:hypothetical protein